MTTRTGYYTDKYDEKEMLECCNKYTYTAKDDGECKRFDFIKNPIMDNDNNVVSGASIFFENTNDIYYLLQITYRVYVQPYKDGHLLVQFEHGNFPYFNKSHFTKLKGKNITDMRKNVDHINGEKFEDSSHKQKFINMMVDVDIKNTDIKLNIVNPTFGKYEEKIHGVFKGTKYGFSEGNYNKNMSEIHKLTLTDKTHRKTDNIEVSDLWDKKNKIHYHVKQIKGDLRVLALQIYNSIKYLTIEVNHTNDFVIKHELAITRDFQVKYVAVVILGEKNTEIKGFKNNWALDLIQKICTTNDIQFEVHVIKYVKHDQLITNI